MVNVSVYRCLCVCAFLCDILLMVQGKPHGDSTAQHIGSDLNEIPEGDTSVNRVNLSFNEISKLPEYIFFNKNYGHTQSLDLYQNRISNVSTYAFWGLEQLKVLDLSDNLIRSLDKNTFSTNRRLHRLVLMNNQIAFDRTQKFLISESIETLILSSNRIQEIYDVTFHGLPKLKRLILSDNELTTVSRHCFEPLATLRYLSIANTGVFHLTETMFAKLPHTINIEDTPMSLQFDPPLTQVRGQGVKRLLQLNRFTSNITSEVTTTDV